MTVLGKILAFINFLFSMAVFALIIMVFTTNTNWRVAADKLKGQAELAYSSRAALEAELGEVRNANEKQSGALKEQIVQANSRTDDVRRQLAASQDEISKFKENNSEQQRTSQSLTDENKRLKAQLDLQSQQVTKAQGEIDSLQKLVSALRREAVDEKTSAQAMRNERDEARGQAKDALRAAATAGPAGRPGGSPAAAPGATAPENVRGKVSEVDSRIGLVTINIGSDAGVQRDQVLQLDRTDSNPPLYLGRLLVLQTNPHNAVGRFTPTRTGLTVRAGDNVRSPGR